MIRYHVSENMPSISLLFIWNIDMGVDEAYQWSLITPCVQLSPVIPKSTTTLTHISHIHTHYLRILGPKGLEVDGQADLPASVHLGGLA